jgi:hypothetical protein
MDQAVTFRDLLSHDPKLSAAESQQRATAELPDRVRRSALAWWPDRTDTNGTGRRLVIGVAVWSNYDLRLLDLVNEAVASGTRPDLNVAVFNLDELAPPSELQRMFPGIGEVLQTPAVGYWEAGQLKETASGFNARQLVARLLGFDPKLILERPAAAAG